MNKDEIIIKINTEYKNYEGYVQFSHRCINKDIDVFYGDREVKVKDEDGFIYEAHFYNVKNKISVSIKQINSDWLINETDISMVAESDMNIFYSIEKKVKMAQLWVSEKDEFCQQMEVKKLKKIVFAGFEKESNG